MKKPTRLTLILLALLFSQCSTNINSIPSSKVETFMVNKTIMEVTTFNINPNVNKEDFKVRDLQIENDYGGRKSDRIHC